MKRLILAAALTALFVTGAVARTTPGQEPQLSPAEVKALKELAQKALAAPPVKVAPAPLPPAVDPPPVVAPTPAVAPVAPPPSPMVVPPSAAPSPVTVSSGPGGETTVSIGTLGGQILTWLVAAFGSLLATIFGAWGVRLFKLAGVQMTDAARARLQEIIVNGLNAGAAEATKDLAGKGQVQIKNEAVAAAVAYAQAHGADEIKKLGLDPNGGAAVEAIKARIETAIADPTVPTPAVLDPVKSAAPAPPPAPIPQPAKV